jgi:GT2 family glycosyltransferase
MTGAPGLNRLGAVVLTYGRANQHRELLEDLRRAGVEPSQIVIAHNHDRPEDGWSPLAPSGATILANPRNVGYSEAMNRGIHHLGRAGHELILLLTHDVRLDQGALPRVVRAADEHPDFGVLGLAVRGAGGAEVSYGAWMPPNGLARHITTRPPGEDVAEVPWVDGCAMVLRHAALDDEPLPERYFMYFEEPELCDGVRARGWRVGTVLDAEAVSESGISKRSALFRYLYIRNGLEWAVRRQGLRKATVYGLLEFARAWGAAPRPWRAEFRQPEVWRSTLVLLAARLHAFLDLALRRFGPPPKWLMRATDVRNA